MAVTEQTTVDVRPLTTKIGAEIFGVDLSKPLDDATIGACRAAMLEHQVVFFPDQHLTTDEHVRAAEQFGELDQPSAVAKSLDGAHPLIVEFNTDKQVAMGGLTNVSMQAGKHKGWHADMTFTPVPPLGALFHMVQTPASGGGDTMFASTQASYDDLSRPIQEMLDDLVAVHGPDEALIASNNAGKRVALEPVEHPVVRVHPETGRRGLFINPDYTWHIKDMSRLESDAILEMLIDHTLRPDHVVRYRWTGEAVAFWDNRAVWHFRVGDVVPGETRIAHRIQLAGTAPFGPNAAPA